MKSVGFRGRLIGIYAPVILAGIAWLCLGLGAKGAAESGAAAFTRVVYSQTYSSGAAASASDTSAAAPTLACSPDNSFSPAGPIAAGQSGLNEQFDSPYYHEMFGYTAQQLAGLSRQCPLVIQGDSEPYINAYTSYWIGWQYDYAALGDGTCQIRNPQVMVHIKQALPAWADAANASPVLAAQWQKYQTAVQAHEMGHVALIRDYSAHLLASLQGYGPQDCASIQDTVKRQGENYLSQLSQVNQDYDAATQHGATQGAIVP